MDGLSREINDFDLIIKNGTLVDGTGKKSQSADIAIKNGLIAAIGTVSGKANQEIDATDLVVTPGFVDIHTHYDGQAIWDSQLKPSSIHGVTTVVMGNCGVGFAPCKPEDRIKLVELMEGVEDIPAPVMHEGLDWQWETFEEYIHALEKSGRPVVFSCTQRHDRPYFWEDLMTMARQAQKEGLPIRPVVTPRPIGLLLGLNGSQNPFSGTDTYKSIADLPLAQRVNEMKKENIKKKILSEDPIKGSTFPLINRIGYSQMYRFGSPPNYNPKPEESIEALADLNGVSAAELAYDILLENEGNNFIYAPLVNYADHTFGVCQKMLEDKNAIMGLGDGGAHVGFILDAGYPTWLISYWSVKKKVFSMEETIRRLTSDTAEAAGLSDRGILKVGLKADVNIIDWENVGSSDPFMTQDLPAGGKRLMQHTHGYVATIVSGKITYQNGVSTKERPGGLVRSVKDSQKTFAFTS